MGIFEPQHTYAGHVCKGQRIYSEEIEQAVLYGSRAKGNFKPFSDIDITLMGDRLTYNTLSSLSDEIDDLLLPYSVDLSIYGKLKNADLLEHIHRMGIPIFSRPSN